MEKKEKPLSDLIENFLDNILPVCSLIIQEQNSNQSYTHLRLNYKRSKIEIKNLGVVQDNSFVNNANEIKKISVRDLVIPSPSLSLKSTKEIDFKKLDNYVNKYKTDKEFKYILNCYYRAIASTDFITKYYNAFPVIELLEKQFRDEINTSLLLDKIAFNNLIDNIQNSKYIDEKIRSRIINRIKSTLKSATLETRSEKLEKLFTNYFRINYIESGSINLTITNQLMSEFIKIRNIIVHDKKFNEEEKSKIFNLGLQLILLIQSILMNWK